MQPPETISERRSYRRYEIQLELRWKLFRRRRAIDSGTGRTIDMSTGGIWFEAHSGLVAGLNIELSIAWPMPLHNGAPLQLVIEGRVVRASGTRAAIRTVAHEFRTRAVVSAQDRQLPGDGLNTRAIWSYTKNALA